jgi:hypothetical protein
MARIRLNNITLCCIDSVQPDRAKKAFDKCMEYFDFGGEVFINDPQINSRQAYSKFILQELHKHIHTDFVLIVQWDGYIINPDAWSPLFLDYDYIGAVWHWHPENRRVGNGGFSLRSKKLCELTAQPEFVYTDLNEDDLICHVNRDYLEGKGMKFAPEELARYFSFERELSNIKTFGFHGDFNFERLGIQ